MIAAPPNANTWGAAANRRSKSSVPPAANSANMPSRNPQSPMRFTMKAFFPASAADGRSYQKPISR